MTMVTERPEATTPSDQEPAPSARRRRRIPWWVYGALLPITAVLVVFQWYPAVLGVVGSFLDWQPGGESTFVGLDNYARMMQDDIWWTSFRNLGIIFLWGVGIWAFPLLASELLITVRNERQQFVFRTLLLLPFAFPGIVTAFMWSFMYHPNNGLINKFLEGIGLGFLAQNWTGDPSLALLALLMIGFPFVAGLPFLVFYSTLRNIPPELFDAAALDGVGRWRRFWAIDLPLMARQVKLLLFLVVIHTLQYGFVAFVVTAGGPDNATTVPVLRMLDVAFQGQNWGYAATLSTTLFVITVVFSLIVVLIRRSDSSTNVKSL